MNTTNKSQILSISIAIFMLAVFLGACNLIAGQPGSDNPPDAILTQAAGTIAAQLTGTAAVATPLPSPTTTQPAPTATSLPPTPTEAQPTPTSIPPTATATPLPCDLAQFVDDVTIPDGTVFAPGVSFTKTWRIKNVGSCTWDQDYSLVFSSGVAMTDKLVYSFPGTIPPGGTVDLTVRMTAPATPGSQKSNWILRNPDHEMFGVGFQDSPIWALIKVNAANSDYIYDFAANFCLADWRSEAGLLDCPGQVDNTDGFVLYQATPDLEKGHENEPALWVRPNKGSSGFISATYPEIKIHDGYHFIGYVGCMADSPDCDMIFTLDYQIDGGKIKNLGEWHEVSDHLLGKIDVDLSDLAGEQVTFILTVERDSGAWEDANAAWFAPSIQQVLPPENEDQAVSAAKRMVASALGVKVSKVDVGSVEGPVEWSDSCLGVHLPDQVCAPAVVPGYRIVMEVGGLEYEAHTNADGSIVFWFEL